MDSLFGPSRSSTPANGGPNSGPLSGYCTVVLHRGIEKAFGPEAGKADRQDSALADTAFTYGIPASVASIKGPNALAPGRLVRVPLGKSNKVATGVVIAAGDATLLKGLSPSRVKPIFEALPASLSPTLLGLGQWLSGYYVAPLGMVLQAMMPASVKRAIGRKLVVFYQPLPPGPAREAAMLAAKLTKPRLAAFNKLIAISQGQWPLTAKAIAAIAEISLPMVKQFATLELLVATTRDVITAHSNPHALALGEHDQPAPASDDASDATDTSDHSDSDAIAGLDAIGSGPATAPKAAPNTTTNAAPARPIPNIQQQRAIDAILATAGHQPTQPNSVAGAAPAPAHGGFSVHLLRGVTGSGKTEVYLTLIERLFAQDPLATALVLVPEIALTPQTSRRFLARFGTDSVAVLHSGLSASQRSSEWARAAAGQVRLVVGARSAVFSPLNNLRLIVVDEEHDSSYKQDQLPRYHARDVAIKRAQLEQCAIVLGSATPSLESWHNATTKVSDGGKRPAKPRYTLHELTIRATGVPMPIVQVVDLREERKLRASGPAGWSASSLHLIGPTLEFAIARTLGVGGQVMLLLNRRGYANYICCPDPKCGFVLQCNHCDATMVYHRSGVTEGYVRCHHCLTEHLLPRTCPLCAKKLNTFGMGTQRVEEELEKKFLRSHGIASGRTMLRADSDSMQRGSDYFDTLDRFARGEVQILLGTQMIAKGLDFPNVQLVGVINADTALDMPDFRASERTFQLISQVAGRAGRGGGNGSAAKGLVIVQTMNPTAPAVVLAQKHDFVTFATEELALRQRVGLPPSGKMARVICRDKVEPKAMDHALKLYEELEKHIGDTVQLRGPMPCAISRIDDHYRIAVELTAATRGEIQRVLQAARAAGLLISDRSTAVDVDPVALL